MIAHKVKEQISKESLERKVEFQEDGSFLSPAYAPVAVHVSDIIPQEYNPNIQTNSAFEALQTSILNTGYVYPILVAPNELYDETLDKKDKPNIREMMRAGRVVEIRDPAIRKYFKYKIIDGSHRSNAIFLNQEIYERENGYIPCTILRERDDAKILSATILMNPIYENQELYVLRS